MSVTGSSEQKINTVCKGILLERGSLSPSFLPLLAMGVPTLLRLNPAFGDLWLAFFLCMGWTVTIWTSSEIVISEHLYSPVIFWTFPDSFNDSIQIFKRLNSAPFSWIQERDRNLHHVYWPVHIRLFVASSLSCGYVPGLREFGSAHSVCRLAAEHIGVNHIHSKFNASLSWFLNPVMHGSRVQLSK